jgi:hypothetical protein
MRRKSGGWFLTTVILLMSACGIEDYVYLQGVPQGNITVELNSRSTIRLPSIDPTYFTHFVIYYRIYASATDFPSITTDENFRALNTALYADYQSFLPYTNGTNTNVSTVGTLFRSKSYYAIEFETGSIDSVLSNGSFGQQIIMDFTQTVEPTLQIGGSSYNLFRSNGGRVFTPRPDRRFLNTADLSAAQYATALINADVTPAAGTPDTRYTYAALYIVATGRDSNFLSIYSAPAFAGVLRLPDSP